MRSNGSARSLRGRVGSWAVAGCGLLLVVVLLPGGAARVRLDSDPRPPSAAQVGAAAGQVNRSQAALGTDQKKLSAASRQLMALRTQAEVLTQRYDQTLVNEQRAQSAYKITETRLANTEHAERLSRRRVSNLAAEQFESGVDFNSASDMLGDESGSSAYLSQVGFGQVLAQSGTDTLASNQANAAVAKVFRIQARDLLLARQADLRAASDLKVAIQAAVGRQADFVQAARNTANTAAAKLTAAKAREASLRAARQAALAAQAAQLAARQAAQQAAAAGESSGTTQAPSWAISSGASQTQGDIAANWALSQLGRPYLWGGAGPQAYDCSGLTMVAWAQAGVTLLHYTGYQWNEGPRVPLDQLQRGDLVFYATDTADPATIHHVGIYIGNGDMVDAPFTGAFVRIDSIYSVPGLIGAIRPAGEAG